MGVWRTVGAMVSHNSNTLISTYSIAISSFLFSLLLSIIANAVPVHAQAEPRESITLSPASTTYKVDAGKSINGKLTIVNDGNVPYDFIIYARPYTIVDNAYDNPNFQKTSERTDLYGWVQFPETRFHIEAGKTIQVNYTIRVPSGVAPGGHYGVIFAETQPPADASHGNAVLSKKRVGSVIYATVNGQVNLSGEVGENSIPFWQVEPPLKATVSAKNTGNTHFTDDVKLTVKDVFGNIKYEATKDYQVLPDTTRTISLEWPKASWFGFYKVETEQKFLDKSSKSEGYVLMMPRFLPVALLLILLIGGVYAVVRRRKK